MNELEQLAAGRHDPSGTSLSHAEDTQDPKIQNKSTRSSGHVQFHHCDRKGGPFRRRCTVDTVDTVDTKIRVNCVNCVNCAPKIHPKFVSTVSTVSIISPKIHPKFIQPFFKLQQPKMMGHRPSHPPIICCIYFMYCPWISRVQK